MKYLPVLLPSLLTFSLLTVLAALGLTYSGCGIGHPATDIPKKIGVELKNTEEYMLDLLAAGDEEGAQIIEQASHYSRSEIVRDSSTNFSPVYFYQADSGYSGKDEVKIEISFGSNGFDGGRHRRVTVYFDVTE